MSTFILLSILLGISPRPAAQYSSTDAAAAAAAAAARDEAAAATARDNGGEETSRDEPQSNHVYAYASVSAEKRLCRELLANYSGLGLNGRPVINMSTPISVTFSLGLINMDLDEKHKILISSMWTKYTWKDDYLQWDPRKFDNITSIKIHSSEIWKPDIMLYNTAETDNSQRKVQAIITSAGLVLWYPHQIFRSSCSVDVQNFPFDSQKCDLFFGSWTHHMLEVNLTMGEPEKGINLWTFETDYKDSCAWDIVKSTAGRTVDPLSLNVVLTFSLEMRRKMVFSSYILTLPCVFLAFLTLVVFWLPADRPDRTSLAMSVFGSFLVLLLILVEAAPPTASSVPVLGIYYCFNMVIIMMSIFLSTLVINVSRGGDNKRRVPKWLRTLTLRFLARFLCVCTGPYLLGDDAYRSVASHEEAAALMGDHALESHTSSANSVTCKERAAAAAARCAAVAPPAAGTPASPPDANNHNHHTPTYHPHHTYEKAVYTTLMALADSSTKDHSYYWVVKEWRLIALVLDRIFFLLYIVAIIISLILLFPRPDYS